MDTQLNFSESFEETAKERNLKEGSDILVQVMEINENYVTVSAGLKSEARIPVDEFYNNQNELNIKVGDTIDVEIDLLDNGMGQTVLSRRNACRKNTWRKIEDAMETDETVEGVIQGRVRGGYSVSLDGLRAFLPGSLADVFPKPSMDDALIGKVHQFKPIKINRQRNSVVLSRRAVIERNMTNAKSGDLTDHFSEGTKINGVVRAIVDYGAFIEIEAGVYGLLHITDMSWKRTHSVADVMNVGDEIETVILRIDSERRRISLGIKQLQPDPWEFFERTHPVGSRVYGKVSQIQEFGIFVEIDDQLQGLVHLSEIAWSRRSISPFKLVNIGDEVEVMILEIDKERCRISLGMKQCKNNPWQEFAIAYRKGDRINCTVRLINEHGIFMDLPGDIEGLVRLSDISYEEKGEIAAQKYQKGQEVETVILNIEADRQRIGLGIKQIGNEKFDAFAGEHLKGAELKATVVAFEGKGARVEVGDAKVRGLLPIGEIAEERVDNINDYLKVGETYDVVLIDIDQRNKRAVVSLKSKERKLREKTLREQQSEGGIATTLGALLQVAKNRKQDLDKNKKKT